MEVDPQPDTTTATSSIPQGTLQSAESNAAGGTQPFAVTESAVAEEKSSKEADAASDVLGQSQDQRHLGTDGDQEGLSDTYI